MSRPSKISINILICLIILLGFIAVGVTGSATYNTIINDDVLNISKLTTTNIYSEIRNELTKPIFVSLTMANDTFLKEWLLQEAGGNTSSGHQLQLQNYLMGIKEKYGYDSVFLISDSSKNYYHYNGINKQISWGNQHDLWYYTFINKQLTYELDVDSDEANKNRLSVFINCRIVDDSGRLLGVTGVGLEIDQLQHLLKHYNDEYDLDAVMFSADGIIQADADISSIENEYVFNVSTLGSHRESILSNVSTLEVIPYEDQHFGGYYITRYVEDLDWYLLIKKDVSVLESSLYSQALKDLVILAVVVVGVLLVSNRIIKNNDKALRKMAKTDSLTKLINRRGFNETLELLVNESSVQKPFFVFVFDIDNFKDINDEYGHLIGDSVLKVIGQLASDVFSKTGTVCRWGGDEFAGYILAEKEEALELVGAFFKRIQDDPEFQTYRTTISMGITGSHVIDTSDTLIYRADKAMYDAKSSGKNRYCMI